MKFKNVRYENIGYWNWIDILAKQKKRRNDMGWTILTGWYKKQNGEFRQVFKTRKSGRIE